MSEAERIARALHIAHEYGTEDGDHHKMWVIDQMVRELTGCPTVVRQSPYRWADGQYHDVEMLGESDEYRKFVAGGYWDEGIAP